MRRAATALVFGALLVGACGGDDGAATTEPTTTSAATTTTERVVTTAVTTTTTDLTTTTRATMATLAPTTTSPPIELSREARSAILRCVDSIRLDGAIIRADLSSFNDDTALNEALDACDDAVHELDVDRIVGELTLDVAYVRLLLSIASANYIIEGPEAVTMENFDDEIGPYVERVREALRNHP